MGSFATPTPRPDALWYCCIRAMERRTLVDSDGAVAELALLASRLLDEQQVVVVCFSVTRVAARGILAPGTASISKVLKAFKGRHALLRRRTTGIGGSLYVRGSQIANIDSASDVPRVARHVLYCGDSAIGALPRETSRWTNFDDILEGQCSGIVDPRPILERFPGTPVEQRGAFGAFYRQGPDANDAACLEGLPQRRILQLSEISGWRSRRISASRSVWVDAERVT